MQDTRETYARIQNIRIKNVEQQVQLMQGELQRLRQGMLHQKDAEKLNGLLERLEELHSILNDLGNYYNNGKYHTTFKQNQKMLNTSGPSVEKNNKNECLNIEHKNRNCSRENAGFDQIESSQAAAVKAQLIKEKTETNAAVNDPFKACKKLMNEAKPPGSILGNYIMRLQDFQADPELRRQRWERKQQEKLLQRRDKKDAIMLPLADKATLTQEYNSSSLTSIENYDEELIPERKANTSSSPYTDNNLKLPLRLPIIKYNLSKVLYEIINDIDKKDIALTIVLENDLYHVSVSQISNGQTLACFFATEQAVEVAKQQHIFQNLLTFLVVNAENSKSQKDRILGHLFEFIKMDIK